MSSLSRQELLDKIESFSYWRYPFDLGDGIRIVPTNGPRQARKRHDLQEFIWPTVLDLCGGSLEGLRVLDVGCNAGFWSLEAVRSGATRVVGIDVRPVHIEQATLVRDALGIDQERLEFRAASVYDLNAETLGTFDLVLLLRVLYHLRYPLLALERVRELCRSYLVADIRLASPAKIDAQSPALYLRFQAEKSRRDTIHTALRIEPTRPAFELMLIATGFQDAKWIAPKPPIEEGKLRLKSYVRGKRALITARV